MNKIILFMITMFFCTLGFSNDLQIYQFPNQKQQQSFNKLTYELRCLVCQNQNLAESNASLAADLRTEIANMIKSGKTNQQIINYLVKRYGDFILYKPPVAEKTYLLWYGPFILLILGISILFARILFLKKARITDSLDSDQQVKVDEVIAKYTATNSKGVGK